MWDIFHPTETISFGFPPPSASRLSSPSSTKRISPVAQAFPRGRSLIEKNHHSQEHIHPAPHGSRPETRISETIPNALSELIASMKPTFLPPVSSEATRCIILSEGGNPDPMLLIKTWDTSLLVGIGIDFLEMSGTRYTTFPDMRLIHSEKERLGWWILREVPRDWNIFSLILQDLGFPPVYTSRSIITTIRNSMNNDSILSQCRFFEIFSESIEERKIRSVTLSPWENNSFVFHTHSGKLIDALAIHWDQIWAHTTWVTLFERDGTFLVWQWGKEDVRIASGEILLLSQRQYERHAFKFTLDTFYIDEKSIGVVAWYTLKDRKELAQNGFLTFVLEEDHARRAILGHIYIDSRWFVHAYEMIRVHKEIIQWIRRIYEQVILENPRIERPDLVAIFRKEVVKLCFLITWRTPVIMPIIQEH